MRSLDTTFERTSGHKQSCISALSLSLSPEATDGPFPPSPKLACLLACLPACLPACLLACLLACSLASCVGCVVCRFRWSVGLLACLAESPLGVPAVARRSAGHRPGARHAGGHPLAEHSAGPGPLLRPQEAPAEIKRDSFFCLNRRERDFFFFLFFGGGRPIWDRALQSPKLFSLAAYGSGNTDLFPRSIFIFSLVPEQAHLYVAP